ncbi:MAG: 2-dehydro-3-deoxy-6-phosphogalactonate aldolase [Pseudoxanthomonas sp.]
MDWDARLPLVAILRGIRPDEALAHVDALVEAGIEYIEVPTNSPEWQRSVALAASHAGKVALIGAGTVLSSEHVDALVIAGGRLMVTPNTDPQTIRYAAGKGLVCMAGFATPSEGFAALAAGAQALKLFPASIFGPGYVKALKAVIPKQVPLFAVGGVTPANLAEFIAAGCIGAGLGTDLYRPGQSVAQTRNRAAAFVEAFKRTKQ